MSAGVEQVRERRAGGEGKGRAGERGHGEGGGGT